MFDRLSAIKRAPVAITARAAGLYADKDWWHLSDDQRACYKCGPGEGVLEKLVPESVYGLCVTSVCSIHDRAYEVAAANIEAKEEADRVFLNNLLRLCEWASAAPTVHWWQRPFVATVDAIRRRRVLKMYAAVKYFGGPAFWRNKNAAETLGQN